MKADSRVHVFNHHLYCPFVKRQGRTYLSELLKRPSLPSVVLRGHSLFQEATHMGSPDMNQTKSLSVILTQCCPPVATDCPSPYWSTTHLQAAGRQFRDLSSLQEPCWLHPMLPNWNCNFLLFCLVPTLARTKEEGRKKDWCRRFKIGVHEHPRGVIQRVHELGWGKMTYLSHQVLTKM